MGTVHSSEGRVDFPRDAALLSGFVDSVLSKNRAKISVMDVFVRIFYQSCVWPKSENDLEADEECGCGCG